MSFFHEVACVSVTCHKWECGCISVENNLNDLKLSTLSNSTMRNSNVKSEFVYSNCLVMMRNYIFN